MGEAPSRCDVVIVGAGFCGAKLAARVANGSGIRAVVIDCAGHIDGDAYSERDPQRGIGSYRHWDMHQAIGAALKAFENALVPHFEASAFTSG